MSFLQQRVEPTSLPEGTVRDLVIDDEGDTLDAHERAALHRRLAAAGESAARGEGRNASDLLEELRARR